MTFKVKKRCIRCRKPLREDGTCQNPKCVRYVPDKKGEKDNVTVNTSADSSNVETSTDTQNSGK